MNVIVTIVMVNFFLILSVLIIVNATKPSLNISTLPIITVTPKATTKSNACIVTINGKSYDVTALQITHSGGNVFICGTDNTSIFFRQHDQRFLDSTMNEYLN